MSSQSRHEQPDRGGVEEAVRRLAAARYLSVTTFRRDGRGVSTPVWFLARDGQLWARSAAESGKVKRIRGNPEVQLTPCTRDGTAIGETVTATAAIVERVGHRALHRALLLRYGLSAVLYDLYWTRVRGTRTVLLQFTVTELPTRPRQPSDQRDDAATGSRPPWDQ